MNLVLLELTWYDHDEVSSNWSYQDFHRSEQGNLLETFTVLVIGAENTMLVNFSLIHGGYFSFSHT